LTPALPRVLERTGFTGVLHCTLDDGQFPTGGQSRIEWEGFGGTTIAAIGCLPLDAGRSEVFLRLAETLSNAMNLDHTSAVMFAHWPGRACRWYDDLRRIASYGTVFGNFLSIDEYFEQTSAAGQRAHYSSDKYRSPYLVQDVTAGRGDPISRWSRYFTRRATFETIAAVETLASTCGASPRVRTDQSLAFAVEDSIGATDEAIAELDDQLAKALQKPLGDLAQALTGRGASPERGLLAVNPHSHAEQAIIRRPSSRDCPLTVETPAMGFAWIGSDSEPSHVIERKGWFGWRKVLEMPPLAAENVLRNEFFEIRFDPQLGSIRTISDYSSRDPRLAQQIALRLPHGGEPGSDQNYSIMAADSLQVTSAGPVLGEMVSRGRLLDREGRRVAGFCQTTRVRRGSRVIEVEIELDTDRQPGPNPWDSYYAVRFAWKDETAKLHRSVSLANVPTELTQFESPHFVDICRAKQHTTLLCGGLPYHRRLGLRMLDTLLAVQGETARRFRFGIGIDVPNPASAALAFLSPPLVLADQPSPPSASGWLFHLDCRNVLATHWQWLPASDNGEQGAGVRVRLLETDGCGVRLGMRCFRKVASACEIDKNGAPSANLAVNGDRIDVPIGPHEWVEVDVRF
jgi:alpha-mannosidase